MMGRYRDVVGDLRDDVKLLYRDLVDLVHNVDGRRVDPVPLDNIDDVIGGGVTPDVPNARSKAILLTDGLDSGLIEVCKSAGVDDGNTSGVFLLKLDIRRSFV